MMRDIFIEAPQEGLLHPTIEEDGRLILSYLDLFDDVFKTEYSRV
jgi:hypothetical protein